MSLAGANVALADLEEAAAYAEWLELQTTVVTDELAAYADELSGDIAGALEDAGSDIADAITALFETDEDGDFDDEEALETALTAAYADDTDAEEVVSFFDSEK